MGLIYTAKDPGHWLTWRQKPENKNLPARQAKEKYLREQIEFQDQFDYHYRQVHTLNALLSDGAQGGEHGKSNNIVGVQFQNTDCIVGPNSGTFIALTASFEYPIRVLNAGGGFPQIQVANNLAGGGITTGVGTTERSNPFTVDFAGVSDDNLSIFFKEQAIPGVPANEIDNDILANTLLSGSADFGNSTSGTATGMTGGDDGLLVLTYSGSHGTPASKTGVNVSASYLVNGGGTDFVNMIVATEQSSSVVYNAGDVFTLNTATQGLGGTGTLTWVVGTEDLTGDTLSFGSGEILTLVNGEGTQIQNAESEGNPELTFSNALGINVTSITALPASSSTY